MEESNSGECDKRLSTEGGYSSRAKWVGDIGMLKTVGVEGFTEL